MVAEDRERELERLGKSRPTVIALHAAVAHDGTSAVTAVRHHNRPPKVLTPELEPRILDTALRTRPGDGGTHKSAAVQRWLKRKRRRRFHFPFTPTGCSWLNQAERFFAPIAERMIRRGTLHGATEPEQAIYKWLAVSNGSPSPFVSKVSAEVILDKVRHGRD